MENLIKTLAISGLICILFGYFRLITDGKGNVNLWGFRLTNCLGQFVAGLFEGTVDLITLKLTYNGLSALAVYLGGLLIYISATI